MSYLKWIVTLNKIYFPKLSGQAPLVDLPLPDKKTKKNKTKQNKTKQQKTNKTKTKQKQKTKQNKKTKKKPIYKLTDKTRDSARKSLNVIWNKNLFVLSTEVFLVLQLLIFQEFEIMGPLFQTERSENVFLFLVLSSDHYRVWSVSYGYQNVGCIGIMRRSQVSIDRPIILLLILWESRVRSQNKSNIADEMMQFSQSKVETTGKQHLTE